MTRAGGFPGGLQWREQRIPAIDIGMKRAGDVDPDDPLFGARGQGMEARKYSPEKDEGDESGEGAGDLPRRPKRRGPARAHDAKDGSDAP
jgi:hypothetical protein